MLKSWETEINGTCLGANLTNTLLRDYNLWGKVIGGNIAHGTCYNDLGQGWWNGFNHSPNLAGRNSTLYGQSLIVVTNVDGLTKLHRLLEHNHFRNKPCFHMCTHLWDSKPESTHAFAHFLELLQGFLGHVITSLNATMGNFHEGQLQFLTYLIITNCILTGFAHWMNKASSSKV